MTTRRYRPAVIKISLLVVAAGLVLSIAAALSLVSPYSLSSKTARMPAGVMDDARKRNEERVANATFELSSASAAITLAQGSIPSSSQTSQWIARCLSTSTFCSWSGFSCDNAPSSPFWVVTFKSSNMTTEDLRSFAQGLESEPTPSSIPGMVLLFQADTAHLFGIFSLNGQVGPFKYDTIAQFSDSQSICSEGGN